MNQSQVDTAGATLLPANARKGVVVFNGDHLSTFQLTFEHDGINHPEHGNILGWPFTDGEISNRSRDLADAVTEDQETVVVIYP